MCTVCLDAIRWRTSFELMLLLGLLKVTKLKKRFATELRVCSMQRLSQRALRRVRWLATATVFGFFAKGTLFLQP